MRSRLATVLTCTAIALAIANPALAASGGGEGYSSFDPYALRASILLEGGKRAVDAVPLHCAAVYSAIRDYNALSVEEREDGSLTVEVIADHNLAPEMIADLLAFAGDRVTRYEVEQCTEIHVDAWDVANDAVVAFAEAFEDLWIIDIEVDGPVACDYGELLLVSATRFWDPSENDWTRLLGRDWTLSGGWPIVSGDFSFVCQSIVPASGDIARVADAVPTTQVHHNPLAKGLTGLDTWLWYDFTQPNSAVMNVGTTLVDAFGTTYAIDAYAWVDQLWWDPTCDANCDYRGMLSSFPGGAFDDELVYDLDDSPYAPAAVYEGGNGTEEGHLMDYVYETKGDYQLATATIWRGYYTYQGVNYLYDPVIVANSEPFQVCEAVGVLTEPGADVDLDTCNP